jgi:DNA-binding response OmpR family regulator
VKRLLLIDDDAELVAVLTLALERADFAVWAAHDARTVLALLEAERPDLVVLDAPLRAANASELLGEIRRRSAAVVVMLTGRGDEDARVAGLEQGADDYVTKPFSPRELVARVRGLLQHQHQGAPVPAVSGTVLQVGPLTLDVDAHIVRNAGRPVVLTPLEFRLLEYLLRHPGTVVTFATLLRQVWGYDDPSVTDVVRSTIYRLRRKLADDPAEPHLLQSVPGIGFRLSTQAPAPPRDAS